MTWCCRQSRLCSGMANKELPSWFIYVSGRQQSMNMVHSRFLVDRSQWTWCVTFCRPLERIKTKGDRPNLRTCAVATQETKKSVDAIANRISNTLKSHSIEMSFSVGKAGPMIISDMRPTETRFESCGNDTVDRTRLLRPDCRLDTPRITGSIFQA